MLAAKNIDELLGQLEASLEVHVARTIREHKAKVDVDHVAAGVEQDVTIVAVLDLQNIAE